MMVIIVSTYETKLKVNKEENKTMPMKILRRKQKPKVLPNTDTSTKTSREVTETRSNEECCGCTVNSQERKLKKETQNAERKETNQRSR
jgi:hypothetical protein